MWSLAWSSWSLWWPCRSRFQGRSMRRPANLTSLPSMNRGKTTIDILGDPSRPIFRNVRMPLPGKPISTSSPATLSAPDREAQRAEALEKRDPARLHGQHRSQLMTSVWSSRSITRTAQATPQAQQSRALVRVWTENAVAKAVGPYTPNDDTKVPIWRVTPVARRSWD